MNFTFLTMTDSPSLGESMTKRMRAQVTKHNFARRREHRARIIAESRNKQSHILNDLDSGSLDIIAASDPSPDYPLRSGPFIFTSPRFLILPSNSVSIIKNCQQQTIWVNDYHRFGAVLSNFKPLLFPSIPSTPDSLHHTAWTSLLVSEPAFLEATLSLAYRYETRHRCVGANGLPPDIHIYRAIKLINRRLEDPSTALSDGILGAVFTLAFNERLAGNEQAWNIHVEGLSQMVKGRRDQGQRDPPRWFFNLLLCDSINELIRSPSASRRRVANVVLGDSTSDQLSKIADISEGIALLHSVLEVFYRSGTSDGVLAREIDRSVERLLQQTSVLRSQEPFISAFSLAIIIFLHISWPHSLLTPSDLGSLAILLKNELGVPDIRLCSSLNLATWLLMVGSVTALDSDTKSWFTGTLKMVFLTLQVSSWDEVFDMLRASFVPDSRLLYRFKAVWAEMFSTSMIA
ncbi:hypothetical protein PT974_00038 [Cladobotryum mycophilum]|uniref:Tachykinin family protein n=1 Tax=Cladobotryum mycophilum TaxID=491253 RepID=A0ABR0SZZ0_9HYPO